MTRTLPRLAAYCAAALAFGVPSSLMAQQPGSFTLPRATPTPTPAPQGPADERAGIVIPPRTATPVPRIAPAPVLTPEDAAPTRPVGSSSSRMAPDRAAAAASPAARPIADAGSNAGAVLARSPTSPQASEEGLAPTLPSQGPAPSPAITMPIPDAAVLPAAPAPDAAREAWPDWWPWAAGAGALLAALVLGLALRRRERRKLPRLAAPAIVPSPASDPTALPRIDIALSVTGATRSVMMFTLAYRITLSNRSDQAITDLNVAARLVCARRGTSNAAPPGAAQRVETVARIGPQQSRSLSGDLRLPLTEIAPLAQGGQPLFIPLVHVTLEFEDQSPLTRSFVIGAPSAASIGRVHPIRLDTMPGSVPGLIAQAIAAPAISAAA